MTVWLTSVWVRQDNFISTKVNVAAVFVNVTLDQWQEKYAALKEPFGTLTVTTVISHQMCQVANQIDRLVTPNKYKLACYIIQTILISTIQ